MPRTREEWIERYGHSHHNPDTPRVHHHAGALRRSSGDANTM
jgi:hypothetical protein